MNKPTQKTLLAQAGNINEATNRDNIFRKGYNKACEEWETYLKTTNKPKVEKKV